MRNEYSRSHSRTRRTSSTTRRDDLADWRRLTRPLILDHFVDRTRDLNWSRELIDLLLDELNVSDEFDELIARISPPAQGNYPQLVALALVLRHSWFPEDLARVIAEFGLSPSSERPAAECLSSVQVVDAADRCDFTRPSPPPQHVWKPQKGEQSC